jgi:phage-related protein
VTTQTFTWSARLEANGTANYRTLKASFGDGYEQKAADGINNKVQMWPLSFVENLTTTTAIRDFLDARMGYQSFYWTPPLGAQGLYRCPSHTIRPMGNGIYELSATFEQCFQP